MNDTITFAVGEPFPYEEVTHYKNVVLKILPNGGLGCIFQFPNIVDSELNAFNAGFTDYSLYILKSQKLIIPIVSFKYNDPINYVNCTIDSNLENSYYLNEFINSTIKNLSNTVTFFMVSGIIIKSIICSGMQKGFIAMLKSAIEGQYKLNYAPITFGVHLNDFYLEYSAKEVFNMGASFKHKNKTIQHPSQQIYDL